MRRLYLTAREYEALLKRQNGTCCADECEETEDLIGEHSTPNAWRKAKPRPAHVHALPQGQNAARHQGDLEGEAPQWRSAFAIRTPPPLWPAIARPPFRKPASAAWSAIVEALIVAIATLGVLVLIDAGYWIAISLVRWSPVIAAGVLAGWLAHHYGAQSLEALGTGLFGSVVARHFLRSRFFGDCNEDR